VVHSQGEIDRVRVLLEQAKANPSKLDVRRARERDKLAAERRRQGRA
jgi:hypothetical protein